MFQILKLRLQGLSAYKIARKLNLDPPMVYASLKAGKTNFATVDKMIHELKGLGWPEKLLEVETQNGERTQKRRTIAQEIIPTRSEEIAFKLG
jgi:hypothetical protein